MKIHVSALLFIHVSVANVAQYIDNNKTASDGKYFLHKNSMNDKMIKTKDISVNVFVALYASARNESGIKHISNTAIATI